MIPKSSGGERPLGIPTVKDRVVQTAVYLVLMPIWEADFHPRSHGFRPQRRAHQAIAEIQKAVQRGYVEIHLRTVFAPVFLGHPAVLYQRCYISASGLRKGQVPRPNSNC